MIRANNLLIYLIFIMSSILFAHEDHNKKKEPPHYDTLTIVNDDTIAINGIPKEQVKLESIKRGTESFIYEEEKSETKTIKFGSLFEHIHNKVIHFPIALTVISFILMLLGYKDDKYLSALKIIIPFATLLSIVAVLAGLSQTEPFEGTLTYSLVETHKLLGFGVLVSLLLWSILLYMKKMKKFIWLLAILTLILVSIAGLYGGVIAH